MLNNTDIVGVCGAIGSGKSYVAKLVAAHYGCLYVSADLVFKEDVRVQLDYQEALSDYFGRIGVQAYVDGQYNSAEISKLLFGRSQRRHKYPILRGVNELNAPFVMGALRARISSATTPVFLEMATLPSFKFYNELHVLATLHVLGDARDSFTARQAHLRRVEARDNRSSIDTRSILVYQKDILAHIDSDHPNVFRFHNMEGGSFLSDDQLIAEADEIIRSALALRHQGLIP